ncbi:MAG: ABC transporter ATP-binding protein [Crenarchaeota archaeon]|nr:ABC transporter ATP-binding protein [Thermoproteota archaeon]MDW8033624.1 ABC transporter ATP-binding protein [Nitrososphaerota archaeon]
MTRVVFKNVIKRYGNYVAVNNVSFEVEHKEFAVLLGPSGSGKTTILKLISGLEFPDGGEIWIGDRIVNKMPPKDRDVAMVFQNYALYPHKTVYENLAFPLKIRKVPKDKIDERVKSMAKLLGIENLLERKPGQLSGGEQQRVALGRALIREPKVWLLDEPLSNLDAKLRTYMRAELKKLQRELEITTIYVTHDQIEAMTLADKLIVLNEGVVQQIGSPRELYDRPANVFVATFIGSPPMNIIKSIVRIHGNSIYLDFGFGIIQLNRRYLEYLGNYDNKEILVGIRPEDIKISFEREENSLKAVVDIVESLGNSSILNLIFGKNTLVKAIYPGYFEEKMLGREIYVIFNPEKIKVFF